MLHLSMAMLPQAELTGPATILSMALLSTSPLTFLGLSSDLFFPRFIIIDTSNAFLGSISYAYVVHIRRKTTPIMPMSMKIVNNSARNKVVSPLDVRSLYPKKMPINISTIPLNRFSTITSLENNIAQKSGQLTASSTIGGVIDLSLPATLKKLRTKRPVIGAAVTNVDHVLGSQDNDGWIGFFKLVLVDVMLGLQKSLRV